MIKLSEILQEEKVERQTPFTTTRTEEDPESGAVTWKVQYDALSRLNKTLEDIVRGFEVASKQYPDDQKIQEFGQVFKALKTKFRTYITKKYKK